MWNKNKKKDFFIQIIKNHYIGLTYLSKKIEWKTLLYHNHYVEPYHSN